MGLYWSGPVLESDEEQKTREYARLQKAELKLTYEKAYERAGGAGYIGMIVLGYAYFKVLTLRLRFKLNYGHISP